jgi:hypothetical protein
VEHSGEHEACEGEVVEAFQCRVEPFVVSSESAETGGPGQASFDHPASWQQDEAAFRHGTLDDFESDALS